MFSFPADCVWQPGIVSVFRYLDSAATYPPDSTWNGNGRFGDGVRFVTYFAESADGALAEFLRINEEFMELQADLTIVMYEVDLDVSGTCVDVRTPEQARLVGISPDRLVSGEDDVEDRYRECRGMATAIDSSEHTGVCHQSAAAAWSSWNLVLMGAQTADTWTSTGFAQVPLPRLTRSQVRTLP